MNDLVTQKRAMMRISVCMAVYNGEDFLREQLESILVQTIPIDEIVIIDDGSTDKSLEIVESFLDPRIRLLKNERNMGVVKTFERSIAVASGDIIFLADQDDIWMNTKVEIFLAAFNKEKCVAIVSDATVIGEHGGLIRDSFFAWRRSQPGIIWNFIRNSYLGCCMAFDARVKNWILPFPNSTPMHDEWIGLVCDFMDRVVFIPDKLTAYRRHRKNTTPMKTGTWNRVLLKRLVKLKLITVSLPKVWFRNQYYRNHPS